MKVLALKCYRYVDLEKVDADGNLIKDLNKGISSVTYTYFDKPQTINFTNGDRIHYSYTAAGNKVQEAIDANHSGKVTDYIGNFVYQDDSLQYAATGGGRTVWSNDTAKEEFFVKDHLGNVRSIIDVYHYPILSYLAGYEIASAQLEDLFFDDVDGIRDDKPGSTNPDDTKAGRLNGAEEDHRVGTSILVKVMAGDKVQINADNYYDGTYDPRNDQPVSTGDMLSSIVSTLTEGVGGVGGSESHNPGLVSKLFNPDNYAQVNDLLQENTDPDRPKAFLNYVLFDQNMRVVRTFTGAWQANGNGGWQTIGNTEPMDIPVNGYLAVYLTNATSFANCEGCLSSEGDVYFDQVNIRFTRGNLKQERHYYPFGLPMAAIGSDAVGATLNRQKYQSNEYITEAGLNWMSFGARQYDPQIGRFLSVDPMASAGGQDMLSPYQAMGNDPVSSVDPGGTRATQIVDQKLIEFNPSPVIYGQVAVNGPPVGYTPEAMEMMGGYTVFTSDWTEGLSNQVSQQVWIDVGDIFIDINGEGVAVPGIMSNLTMDAGSGSGGDGFSGGDPPSGDGKGDSSDGSNSKGSSTGEKAKDQAGNIGLTLSLAGYEMEQSSSLGFSKWGAALGKTGDALGFAGLYFDYKNYKAGKMSGGKFSYHAFSFGASTIIGNTMGASAGLETGGFLFYLETVQLEGQVLWNSFKTSYNSWYQQSEMIIENGGNPFEHMHYSF